MQKLLEKIYAIENFSVYILTAIGVLVVLFIVILVFGKKDKKIEETKRLEKLKESGEDEKAIKEETIVKQEEIVIEPEPVVALESTPEVEKSAVLDNEAFEKQITEEVSVTTFVPSIDDAPVLEPVASEIYISEEATPVLEPTVVTEPRQAPVMEPIEIKPEVPVMEPVEIKEEPITIINIDSNIEEPKEKELIEIPEFNFDDLASTLDDIKEEKKETTEIFSSVFPPERAPIEEENQTEIDLPKLKEEDITFKQIEGEEYNINK